MNIPVRGLGSKQSEAIFIGIEGLEGALNGALGFFAGEPPQLGGGEVRPDALDESGSLDPTGHGLAVNCGRM